MKYSIQSEFTTEKIEDNLSKATEKISHACGELDTYKIEVKIFQKNFI